MTFVRSTACAALFLTVLAATPHPAAADETAADEKQVVATMQIMFDSIANGDMTRYHEVTAPDFYAFDMGENMTSTQLVETVGKARETGVTFTWNVTEPQVHIDGRTAWITYVNRGSIQKGTNRRDMAWLESAVLRRTGDDWRLRFLHSTPLTQPENTL